MLKKALFCLAIVVTVVATSSLAPAATYVRGYYRSNGTYVQPHYRSSPDRSFYNNWSTRPNVNPYTVLSAGEACIFFELTLAVNGDRNCGGSGRVSEGVPVVAG